MKQFLFIALIFLASCSLKTKSTTIDSNNFPFTETEILRQLDLAFNGIPSDYVSEGNQDMKYISFLDLEHPYCITAGSKIHLYADSTQWAIVFEKSGYQTGGGDAEIELNYVGNCINYPVVTNSQENYRTNTKYVIFISGNDYETIANKTGTEDEQFEFISPTATEVNVHGRRVKIEHDPELYKKAGIKFDDSDNPRKLIGYGDLVRYLNETNPKLISATQEEIKRYIPKNLPEIITIDQFHFTTFYDKSLLPSKQETYQLIAKVLVSKNAKDWKPTLKANNHWTNWESVNL